MFKRFVVILSIIVAISGLASPVWAQTSNGTITGKLTNGTDGGGTVANVEVRLEAYVGSTLASNLTTTTNDDGSYEFNNLVTGAQNSYRVALSYQEADYFGGNITFAEGESNRSENITVYDSTDNSGAVTIDTAHTIIYLANDELEFTIVYDFINNTDKAFIGTGDPMANGKKKTLTFSIPPEATGVQYGDGLLPGYVYPSHEGFIDTLAVLPGIKEIVYAYVVPFTGGTYSFNQKLSYPADWFNLLVQGDGIKIASKQLIDQGPLDMGAGNTYLYYTGQNFSSGDTVSATISVGGGISQTLIIVLGVFGLVVVLGGGLALWRRQNGRGTQPAVKLVSTEEDENSLLLELARLDDEFSAGLIPEDTYKAQRAAKKAQLVRLMSGKRG